MYTKPLDIFAAVISATFCLQPDFPPGSCIMLDVDDISMKN